LYFWAFFEAFPISGGYLSNTSTPKIVFENLKKLAYKSIGVWLCNNLKI
jgi:hypothetical protein